MNAALRSVDLPSYVFDGRRLELLKWLAFVAMIFDHVSLFFFDHSGLLFSIGRFAFPVFSMTFGIGLCLSRDPSTVLSRLLFPGLLAEVFWRFSSHSVGVNVLLSFWLVGVSCLLFERSRVAGSVALISLLFVHFMEGGFLTPLLVAGAYLATRFRSAGLLLLVSILGGLTLPFIGSALAFAALLLLPAVPVPRFRWFAWAYAGHVALFAVLTTKISEVTF
jgi:hypothetical protein